MDEKHNPKTDEVFCVHRRSLQEKKIEKKERRGRKSGLWVSEILTIQIWFHPSKCRDFKTFYRRVFSTFFLKNVKLFLIYETDKTTGEDVPFYWKDEAKQGYFLHRFDATSSVQKCTPSKPQNIQKYSKLGPFIGLHNVWVKIVSRPECTPKIREIILKNREIYTTFPGPKKRSLAIQGQ